MNLKNVYTKNRTCYYLDFGIEILILVIFY